MLKGLAEFAPVKIRRGGWFRPCLYRGHLFRSGLLGDVRRYPERSRPVRPGDRGIDTAERKILSVRVHAIIAADLVADCRHRRDMTGQLTLLIENLANLSRSGTAPRVSCGSPRDLGKEAVANVLRIFLRATLPVVGSATSPLEEASSPNLKMVKLAYMILHLFGTGG